MDEPSDDDRPWTEAEWERFMYESDVRNARYGDLLETFHDHPDCQEIVEREMGWDKIEISDELAGNHGGAQAEIEEEDQERAGLGLDAEDSEEAEEFDDRRNIPGYAEVPGYAEAFDWALHVHEKLQPFVRLLKEPEPDDPLIVAYGQSMIVAAKIVGGDAMGRHEETMLCANIACLKRALTAANNSLEALQSLRTGGDPPADVADDLLSEGHHVRELMESRNTELRARVWWE